MKFRTDFVTNSSSSSFILSFKDRVNDELTIEDAYQLMYKMYVKHYELVMDVINFIKSDPNSRMTFDKDGFLRFKNGKYEFNDEGNKKYWKKIQKKIGNDLDQYDIYEHKVAWVPLCPTYEDYCKYWEDQLYNNSNYNISNHAPFSICDYRADTMKILHYRRSNYDWDTNTIKYYDTPIEIIDKSYNNDELGWYFCYLDEFLEDENFEPSQSEWNDPIDEEELTEYQKILKIREEIKDDGLFIETVLNGRFAILSECGYIPDSIVNKLKDECEYSCNHMG